MRAVTPCRRQPGWSDLVCLPVAGRNAHRHASVARHGKRHRQWALGCGPAPNVFSAGVPPMSNDRPENLNRLCQLLRPYTEKDTVWTFIPARPTAYVTRCFSLAELADCSGGRVHDDE